MSTTTIELSPYLKFSLHVINGYVGSFIEDKNKKALRMNPSGVARAASIFGYIVGLHDAGQTEFAERMAHDIIKSFTYLDDMGHKMPGINPQFRTDGTPLEYTIPSCIVELAEDGTRWGFSFLMRRAVRNEDVAGIIAARGEGAIKYDGHGFWRTAYAFSMNGGLLYHGPKGEQTFSVNLCNGSNFWSTHT